jgi:malate dehydrogenase (oxaloacetate-decarboxylating)
MKDFERRVDPKTGEQYLLVAKSGIALKNHPILNKGTAFPRDEREEFGLSALFPEAVSSHALQKARAYENYCRAGDEVQRYIHLTALQDRNETLFYSLLLDHIEEMMPIVYTPTVGQACERYSHLYRRGRGLYITPRHRGRIAQLMRTAPVQDCQVMVVTDNEAILGLGDLGVGGMGIPIGKLTLYTAGAGIHPATCLPVDIDVGTNNPALLEDPFYLGLRQPRVRGDEYFELLDEFVDAVREAFPGALVQWEDFSNENAFAVLERYRDKVPSFDDDIQGTGAVVVAGIVAALKQAGRTFADERAVFFGAGAAGGGTAMALRTAMMDDGLSEKEARARILALDSRGLILSDRRGLRGQKIDLATDPSRVEGWEGGHRGAFGLLDVVRNFKPTILIGMAGQPGSFGRELIEEMHRHCARPIVFPLSNPTSKAEATPAQLIEWTRGEAIVATGSPFAPVQYEGRQYEIGQANNVLIFPGAGLGAIAARAHTIPETSFLAASKALGHAGAVSTEKGTSLFPPLTRLRQMSRAVAKGVAKSLVETGAAPEATDDELEKRIDELTWEPVYLPYRSA